MPPGESRGILVLTKRERGMRGVDNSRRRLSRKESYSDDTVGGGSTQVAKEAATAIEEFIGGGRRVPTDKGEVGSGRRVPTDLGEPSSQSSARMPEGVDDASRSGETGGRRVPTEIGEAQAGGGRSVPTERGDMHTGGRKEPTEQGEAGAELQPSGTEQEAASKKASDSTVREPNGRGG